MTKVSSSIELKSLLNTYAINTENWGKNDAKTIDDLFREIKSNDCELSIIENKLVRTVKILIVLIRKDNLILMEKEQILVDGRKRVRNLP